MFINHDFLCQSGPARGTNPPVPGVQHSETVAAQVAKHADFRTYPGGWTAFEASDIEGAKSKKSIMSTKGEADVVFKGIIAATAAVIMAASPAIAAGSAAKLQPATEQVRGSMQVDDEDDDGSGLLVAVLAVLAALGGVWAATSGGGDAPVSPN
ncbi:MAG TPA: hypothetical protein VGW34_12200 [Allosphingosinicella sp.]|nr:hypothetical protein [Allosphingosinicella sp.]